MTVATIHDTTPDGLFEIIDTRWDHNGTMFVTVRETMGGNCLNLADHLQVRRARRLARRAIHYPEATRSSRLVRTGRYYDCKTWTFAVSRLEA